MDRFDFWQRWLLILGGLITVLGVAIALLNSTELFDTLLNNQIDPVFWDEPGPDDQAQDFRQWAYGVLGATMAGWGVFITTIAHYPFKRRERWAWNCMLAGIAIWFVLDTYVSLSAGNWFNELAVNVPLLVLVLLPLWFTRKDF